MALYVPPDRRVRISDGTAAASATVPGTLLDLSANWRSGGDISVEQKREMRGVANRPADEWLYLRRVTVGVSDSVFEQDDDAGHSGAAFNFGDARTANLRAFQVQYRSGVTRTTATLIGMMSDLFQPEGVLQETIGFQATGELAQANF